MCDYDLLFSFNYSTTDGWVQVIKNQQWRDQLKLNTNDTFNLINVFYAHVLTFQTYPRPTPMLKHIWRFPEMGIPPNHPF